MRSILEVISKPCLYKIYEGFFITDIFCKDTSLNVHLVLYHLWVRDDHHDGWLLQMTVKKNKKTGEVEFKWADLKLPINVVAEAYLMFHILYIDATSTF